MTKLLMNKKEKPLDPADVLAKETIKKDAARAPQQAHGKAAPRVIPPVSGKPIWDKPHSS